MLCVMEMNWWESSIFTAFLLLQKPFFFHYFIRLLPKSPSAVPKTCPGINQRSDCISQQIKPFTAPKTPRLLQSQGVWDNAGRAAALTTTGTAGNNGGVPWSSQEALDVSSQTQDSGDWQEPQLCWPSPGAAPLALTEPKQPHNKTRILRVMTQRAETQRGFNRVTAKGKA